MSQAGQSSLMALGVPGSECLPGDKAIDDSKASLYVSANPAGLPLIAHRSEKETPVQVIEIEINWDEHLPRWMQHTRIEGRARTHENINNPISSGCHCCADLNRVICELR